MTTRTRRQVCHIRRDDEINITYCGLTTAFDAEVQPTVEVGRGDIAIFDDAEAPASTTQCHHCWPTYIETH